MSPTNPLTLTVSLNTYLAPWNNPVEKQGVINFFQWCNAGHTLLTHDSGTTISYFCVHTHTQNCIYALECLPKVSVWSGQMHDSLTSPQWDLNHLPSTLQTAYFPLHHQDPVLQCISRIFEGNIVGHRSLICQSCHALKFDWWWIHEELGDHYQRFSFLLMGCLSLCVSLHTWLTVVWLTNH